MTANRKVHRPYPSLLITGTLIALVAVCMVIAILWLLSIDDAAEIKRLIEDDGPVQMLGQSFIALAFVGSLLFAIFDKQRRSSFIPLSYLLMFYTLREADYHSKVSEFAKASQIKRFYLHELIPLSTKLFMGAITILLLVVLYRYVKRERAVFLAALRQAYPWAILTFCWAGVIAISQIIDQLPMFHNVTGQVFEEVFESSAEVLALMALIVFGLQLRVDSSSPPGHKTP